MISFYSISAVETGQWLAGRLRSESVGDRNRERMAAKLVRSVFWPNSMGNVVKFYKTPKMSQSTYTPNLYPESSSSSSAPLFGVCLSGGGSRALSCALGQLSALDQMINPKTGSSVLAETPYLSSVSGGSWASVLYTFLPTTIGGQPVSDSDFLIAPVAPGSLTLGDPTQNTPGNVAYMGPFCMGNVPQGFGPVGVAEFLYVLYTWGFLEQPVRWRWFWIAGIGEIVLKRFGLYSATYDSSVDYPQPSQFFSLSASHIAASITPNNPSLTLPDFYVCRDNRPSLIVNANVLQDLTSDDSPQIPVQATAIATLVPGESPDTTIQGGGGVESFAFTSTLIGPGSATSTASVSIARRYSLCDIAGCSSAFFAAYLLDYLDKEIDNIMTEVENILIKHDIPKGVAEFIVSEIKHKLDAFLNAGSEELIPQYNYWPLSQVAQKPPANNTYGFSDGGDFDNSGILGMLAQTGVNRILSFSNSEIPITRDANTKEVVLDSSLALLFGYQDTMVNGEWVSFGGMCKDKPWSYVQVFSDDGNAFKTLREGLYAASLTGTAAFLQTVTTVENPVANIQGGRQVQVLWMYNNRVDAWQSQITDSALQTALAQGQSVKPTGLLANFPNYFTGEQIALAPEAVNMLAQFSAWNVQQMQSEILTMLG